MPTTMKLCHGAVSCVYYAAHQVSLHRYAEVDQVGIRKFGTSWVVGIHIDRTEYCGGGMAVATFAMVRRQR